MVSTSTESNSLLILALKAPQTIHVVCNRFQQSVPKESASLPPKRIFITGVAYKYVEHKI